MCSPLVSTNTAHSFICHRRRITLTTDSVVKYVTHVSAVPSNIPARSTTCQFPVYKARILKIQYASLLSSSWNNTAGYCSSNAVDLYQKRTWFLSRSGNRLFWGVRDYPQFFRANADIYTGRYSGVNLWPWNSGWDLLPLHNKYIDSVNKQTNTGPKSLSLSTGHSLLGVEVINSLV